MAVVTILDCLVSSKRIPVLAMCSCTPCWHFFYS
jgi:hypothetical protein